MNASTVLWVVFLAITVPTGLVLVIRALAGKKSPYDGPNYN